MESRPGPGWDESSPELGQPGHGADAGELERGAIEVAGVRRTYWLARAPRRAGQQRAAAPLLIVLHGSGMDGRSMAQFTGLARIFGPIARHLDATGILLDMAARQSATAAGHRALGPGGFP